MFGLSFFNPYLLWGLTAAAIPILIHLFNRRRFRTVVWAAMDFLLSSSKMTARRLKIIQALLLLTRMAIVSFLVAGVARPYLTAGFFGGALARSKSSVVIILDNSYSMGLREGNGTSFGVAKEAAKKLVTTFRNGDSVTYVLMAARPKTVTEGNPSPERVRKLIENSELCDEGTDILSALSTGLEVLASEKNTRKELFLITDCQRSGWGAANRAGWDRINELLSSGNVPPRIYLLDVSRPAGENVTVTSVELPAYPCGVGKRYMVTVGATTSAEKPQGRPVFTLFLDDEKKEIRRAEGSDFKDGSSQARLIFSVEQPGSHWAKVEVGADCLLADNARYFQLKARRSVPILCVDEGQPDTRFGTGTGFLAYAFAPEKGTGVEGREAVSNVLDPKVIRLEQFWEENLRQYDIVVLSDVGTISGRMHEELSDFVANGGGLMIFLGENVDAVRYSGLYESSSKSFLPCAIGSAKGEALDDKGKEAGQNVFRISEVDFGNPAMAAFRAGTGGDLSIVKFYKFFSVEPDASDPELDVLARFGDGSPYLVEKTFGRGKTILFTSSCDLSWSNLPLNPVFLPLVHRLAYYVVSGEDARYNLTVGDKIVQRAQGAASSPSLMNPAGTEFKLVVSGGRIEEENGALEPFVSFDDTSRAGIYTLKTSESSVEKPNEQVQEEVQYFAVNVNPEESDLSVLKEAEIENLIRWNEFRYVKAETGAVEGIARIREGKEIWRYLVVGVLCFLVLESVLARQIDKG
jgi:hypothetical protein